MSAPEPHTLSSFVKTHEDIISSRAISPKTIRDKIHWLGYLTAELGHREMGSIAPYEIAALASRVAASGRETAARRVVIEAKDLFYQALLHGVIFRDPAAHIKPIKPAIKRMRLSLDNWTEMHQKARPGSIHRRLLRLALVSAQRCADLCAMRFDHVYDDHLHVVQQKTGRQIRIPLQLRLSDPGIQLGEVIEECRQAAGGSDYMLPMRDGSKSAPHRLSYSFTACRAKIGIVPKPGGTLPSLHETRSLAERLYRYQGVDTQVLLGHKFPRMTNIYNDDRGLSSGEWKTVRLSMPNVQ